MATTITVITRHNGMQQFTESHQFPRIQRPALPQARLEPFLQSLECGLTFGILS